MMVPQHIVDGVEQYTGDALAVLKTLPAESVDCVVTSPPYWGLRNYGVEGQMGCEPCLGDHIDALVNVFGAVRRVLKPTGSCWLNYGDCYAAHPNGRSAEGAKAKGSDDRTFRDKPFSTVGPVYSPDSGGYRGENKGNSKAVSRGRILAGGYLKPKDLCLAPARLSIALQEAGWWIRQEIIWAKPNPMPESVRDRPACAFEKIFLLTKSFRYFYAHKIVRLPSISALTGQALRLGRRVCHSLTKDKQRGHGRRHAGFNGRWDAMSKAEQSANGRNLRNWEPFCEHDPAFVEVWEIATRPFGEAHFATFPPELAARCIKAGCPKGGVVLDPFSGAGTTALAAIALGCKAILIELNPDYVAIAERRIKQALMGPLDRAQNAMANPQPGPLFGDLRYEEA